MTVSAEEALRLAAKRCVNRMIATGILQSGDDDKAQEIFESYLENFCQRLLCGEFDSR